MSDKKICSFCGEERPLSEYYVAKHTPDGLYYHCKICDRSKRAAYQTKYWKKYNEDAIQANKHYVYLLPKENYVGYTRRNTRFREHKYLGRDIEGFKIMHVCNTEEHARSLEKMYHKKGYEGGN